MNTKLLMTSSAIILGVFGILLTFLPKEIMNYLTIETDFITLLFMQILGSLYLGFGMLNWMAKDSSIGGIYNKPITIGNFMHFGVAALTLVKVVFKIQEKSELIISLTIVYAIFAICFAYVFMTSPKNTEKKK